MRLHHLRVEHFGSIRRAELPLAPGLNVLYGPNELGKSTLTEAIRLALLLPYSSSHHEAFVPWSGTREPTVELTFEVEPERIFRVRKRFGRTGGAHLHVSRNGVDWDEVAKARAVDAQLREVLGWGIPEPGGAGGGRGLPTSFLAAALLSTQGDVSDVLARSLDADLLPTGKERIAAALQAVAQDPLFVQILNETRDRRDQAFTERGARKSGKDSVFRIPADRVTEARKRRDALEKQVEESAGVEGELRALTARLEAAIRRHETAERALDAVREAVAAREARTEAELRVAAAEREVQRIDELAARLEHAEQAVVAREQERVAAEDRVEAAQRAVDAAQAQRDAALAGEGSDGPGLADQFRRQQLALTQSEAARAIAERENALDLISHAERRQSEGETIRARAAALDAQAAQAVVTATAATAERVRIEEEIRSLDAREAEDRVAALRAETAQAARLAAECAEAERAVNEARAARAALVVPADLAPLRKLDRALAEARAALEVGLVVTVTPHRAFDLSVSRDGVGGAAERIDAPVEVTADAQVELEIGKQATVRISGGRPAAQQEAARCREQWEREVAPHLAAAGVDDLAALEERWVEARALDHAIATRRGEMATLQAQLAPLADSSASLARALAARDALGPAADVPAAEVGARRAAAGKRLEAARRAEADAQTAAAEARAGAGALAEQVAAADAERAALRTAYPQGLAAARAAAEADLRAARTAEEGAGAALRALEEATRQQELQWESRSQAAAAAVAQAQDELARAIEARGGAAAEVTHARSQVEALVRAVAAEDRAAAVLRVDEARAALAAHPLPAAPAGDSDWTRAVADERAAREARTQAERDVERKRGALEQVGGAVARERLAQAREACELAERHEREVEAEYDAWKLLFHTLTEAEAAQASHLGQALGPLVSDRFRRLTGTRYDRLQLDATLGTQGVVADGGVRDHARLSIGAKEQLSTLYRLALAECLGSVVVLDDQLVQSDTVRMEWFRTLLREKAAAFQIVIFTCRPEDYLGPTREDDGVYALDLRSVVER